MKKSAIVTYLYPGSEIYLEKFIINLNLLENHNLIVYFFNDESKINKEQLSKLRIEYRFIENTGSINATRYKSFQILKNEILDFVMFQDIDDLFSKNRFDVLKDKLDKYSLVCNDLDIVQKHHKIENYWGKRLGDNFEFDYNFIKEKNIVGLGNTAVRREVLSIETFFSDEPVAYDWYYFYQVLKTIKQKCLFTTSCKTYYTQHDNNIAGGNKKMTDERIKHIVNVKTKHYNTLIKQGYVELKPYVQNLSNRLEKKIDSFQDYFWWEELS